MNVYMIRYSDGLAARVQASNTDSARNKAYSLYRSGVIVSIDKM